MTEKGLKAHALRSLPPSPAELLTSHLNLLFGDFCSKKRICFCLIVLPNEQIRRGNCQILLAPLRGLQRLHIKPRHFLRNLNPPFFDNFYQKCTLTDLIFDMFKGNTGVVKWEIYQSLKYCDRIFCGDILVRY